MKTHKKIFTLSFLACLTSAALFLNSCSKSGDDTSFKVAGLKVTSNASTLTMSFQHFFGSDPLKMDGKEYTTAANDIVRILELKYYITNVTLVNDAGTSVNLGNCNLINAAGSTSFTLTGLPAGTYKKISFTIGVDQKRNSSGSQEGDLSPSMNMFWTWSTGYVYYKINGTYGPLATQDSYSFDIGGLNNLTYTSAIDISSYSIESGTPKFTFKSDAAVFFNSPKKYDLKTNDKVIHTANPSPMTSLDILRGNIPNTFTLMSVTAN